MYLKKFRNRVVEIQPGSVNVLLGEVEYPPDYILDKIIIAPVVDTEHSTLTLLLTNNYTIPEDEGITLSSTNLVIEPGDMSITSDSIKIIGSNSGSNTAIYNILFVFKRIVVSYPDEL